MLRRSKGCTESPVARLVLELKALGEGEELILKVDPSVYPVEALKVLAEKRGFRFEVLEEGPIYTCVIRRG